MVSLSTIKKLVLLVTFAISQFIPAIFSSWGILKYFAPIIISVAIIVLIRSLFGLKEFFYYRKTIAISAFLTAVVQVTVFVILGLVYGFGLSPYSFHPLMLAYNILMFTSTIIAFELVRFYVIKGSNRHYFAIIILTSIFLTLISFSYSQITSINDVKAIITLVGKTILPNLSRNLLLGYLTILGGPVSALAYALPIEAFNWLSPLLPKINWPVASLMYVLIPIIGLIVVNDNVSPMLLARFGFTSMKEAKRRHLRHDTPYGWVITALITVMLFWSSTGLLGYQFRVIATGSMRPSIEVGDMVLTIETRIDQIRVGDVIQYYAEGVDLPIIHRVMEIEKVGEQMIITTKGDSNSFEDDPVIAGDTAWRLVFVIPKIGWLTIYIRDRFSTISKDVLLFQEIIYPLIGITITILSVYSYREIISKRRHL